MKTENYPNWLVSIEQAKKLKEIGFDSLEIFVDKSGSWYKGGEIFYISVDGELTTYSVKEMYLNGDKSFIPTYTYEQVFKQFRERDLHSHIEVFYTNIKYDKKSPKIFNERKTEILEKPITLYNYFTGHKANGTFIFGASNNTITLHAKNYKSYEKCREDMVNSLIKLYKNGNSV